jgi:ribosomal protein L11 methyltransferase
MPYRIHLPDGSNAVVDRLIELGALDVETPCNGGVDALMPDAVAPGEIEHVLGVRDIAVSPAVSRDEGSVWILAPRPVYAGRLRIAPVDAPAAPGTIRLLDTPAFGTGLHPTTALCLEILDHLVAQDRPASMLDVGTGSGVLALAALALGVPRVTAVDIDAYAVRVAGDHARLNHVDDRLELRVGGPDAVPGTWPLVVANILAAPLIEMAPTLVRQVSSGGRLVLSGIATSLEDEVRRAYIRAGMRHVRTASRAGWNALVLAASW